MSEPASTPFLQRVVEVFLRGNLSVVFITLSLIVGVIALAVTPREEEPQIIVPIADVFLEAPGASAEEVERQVATPLEKLLYQIDGVEYVYSMSRPGSAIVTVRFYVGQDREDSLIKLYNKIQSNLDIVPTSIASWVVKPVEIDDVPIVNITLYSGRYDDSALRRLAEEIEIKLQGVKNTNQISVIGGRPRTIRVQLDSSRLAAHSIAPLDVAQAFRVSNVQLSAGTFEATNAEYRVEAGRFLKDVEEVRSIVVGVHEGRPVRLDDVAEVLDAPAEASSYTRTGFGPAAEDVPESLDPRAVAQGELYPAVNIAVAKKKGTNAVWVARAIERKMEELQADLFPDEVYYRITRNYGETANDKVNELVEGLALALLIVIGLFVLTLGWREALIVSMAVPLTFSLTLLVNYLAGYSINRVTLFALILVLGLVVDDPIVDVENIYRHLKMKKEPPYRAVITAVNEVRPPIILTTIAVILSFIPLFFITGMMGPYMGPMALNVPIAMTMGTVVALTVTPWMSYHLLKGVQDKDEEAWVLEKSLIYKFYRAVLPVFCRSRLMAWALIGFTVMLFGWAGWLAMNRDVPLKMLPFDNKNEFQIVIDMPEGTTLEATDAVTNAFTDFLRGVPEVTDFQTYVGTASAMDFNGMVRHYYLRKGSNVADIRVGLAEKDRRDHQSHEIVLRLRDELTALARERGANIKIVEVPPGPPVIATVAAEIYGRPDHSYADLIASAKVVRARMEIEAGVVDVDDSVEDDQVKFTFVTDKEKAALNGISTDEVAKTVALGLRGLQASMLRDSDEVHPLPIELRLPRAERSSLSDIERLYVKGRTGNLVTLGEIGHFEQAIEDKTIYHKNLERVCYVFAEMAGRAPAEAVLDIQADRITGRTADPITTGDLPEARPASDRSYMRLGAGLPWHLGEEYRVVWSGEGEWDITLRVFRDLGIAFGAACLGIYVLLLYQTGSYFMPLILMISIPLTVIGIMPGFWLLNFLGNETIGGYQNPVFITATAMIGMIALSGIAVRNSILLIEFAHLEMRRGIELQDSLINAGAVRFRPILLTAGSAMLAAWPITLDPIFSGLAWALIFGLFVSTVFSLLLVPVVYWMAYQNRPGHGLPQEFME